MNETLVNINSWVRSQIVLCTVLRIKRQDGDNRYNASTLVVGSCAGVVIFPRLRLQGCHAVFVRGVWTDVYTSRCP